MENLFFTIVALSALGGAVIGLVALMGLSRRAEKPSGWLRPDPGRQKDVSALIAVSPEELERRRGEWALVLKGKILGWYPTQEAAYEAATAECGEEPFSIASARRVPPEPAALNESGAASLPR